MHTHIPNDDPYALLGIATNASSDQIRRAYRRLAMDWHPDRNDADGAEETFKRIRLAYELLRDPDRRAEYDRSARPARPRRTARGQGAPSAAQTPTRETPPKSGSGGDLKRVLRIGLEQQPAGFRARLRIARRTACDGCGGTGQGGHTPQPCSECLGSGRVRRPLFGFLFAGSAEPCPACGGKGRVPPRCAACGGTGRGTRAGYLNFEVPAGVHPGSTLRVRGHGRAARPGETPGDLLVRIELQSHPFFRPAFPDLECEVPVGLLQALAGTTFEVPTLEGVASVTLPPGAGDSTDVRLPGLGLLDGATGRRGDLVVKPRIIPPEGLTAEQLRLLEQLRQHIAATPRELREWARRMAQAKRRMRE